MRGIPLKRSVWILAAIASSFLATVAQGQQFQPADQPYQVSEPGPAVQTVAGQQEVPDLAARVTELENALKKAAQKEAEDKKKAAGKPSVVVQGRIHADAQYFNQSPASRATIGDAQDAVHFRTARIGVGGDMFDVFNYRFEVDLAARSDFTTTSALHTIRDISVSSFKDMYVGVKELPVLGTVQIGHYKEPFSLEQLTSSRYISFMERSLADTFVPARDMGIMAMNTYGEEHGTWAIGVFRPLTDVPPFRADDDGGRSLTGRVTWLPWYDEATEGRGLFHLGLGYIYHDLDEPIFSGYAVRPEIGLMKGPLGENLSVVRTGAITDVTDQHKYGTEAAFVYGPWSVQGEWIGNQVMRTGAAEDAQFSGYYVFVSYFLTGENRVYRRSAGAFDRIKPYENFFRVRDGDGNVRTGKGAWEILYRYSSIDLWDPASIGAANPTAGIVTDHTLALTWYWNPYIKLMFNYIHSTAVRPGAGVTVPIDVFGTSMRMEY